MAELTKEQAIALAESGFWENMTSREIAKFQLHTRKLCMPFGVFHKAVEEALGRPVWTHEFAGMESLQAELRGEKAAPSFREIVEMIPAEKRVLVVTDEETPA